MVFRETTGDVEAKIENLLAEAQEAYDNSKIPIKFTIHCLKELGVEEHEDSSTRLRYFKNAKGEVMNDTLMRE